MRIASIRLSARLIPALIATVLLLLGVPQAVDSMVWALADSAPDQLGAAGSASDKVAAREIGLLEGVDRWVGDPRARIRAGILRLRRAADQPDAAAAAERLHGIADLTSGLARFPASAVGWTALAQAQLAVGNLAAATAAFKASILIDDHDPQLSLWRCGLGLMLWNALGADDRRLWTDQVRETWKTDPAGLVALAHQSGGYATPIRLALILDPNQLAAFDRALASRPQ